MDWSIDWECFSQPIHKTKSQHTCLPSSVEHSPDLVNAYLILSPSYPFFRFNCILKLVVSLLFVKYSAFARLQNTQLASSPQWTGEICGGPLGGHL